MSACHQRAAESIVEGAIKNGGLYIKLGQGLCAFNHLLPPEYIHTLQVLEDKALNRRYKEVSSAAQAKHRTRERGLSDTGQDVSVFNRWTLSLKKTSTRPLISFLKHSTMSPSLLPA